MHRSVSKTHECVRDTDARVCDTQVVMYLVQLPFTQPTCVHHTLNCVRHRFKCVQYVPNTHKGVSKKHECVRDTNARVCDTQVVMYLVQLPFTSTGPITL